MLLSVMVCLTHKIQDRLLPTAAVVLMDSSHSIISPHIGSTPSPCDQRRWHEGAPRQHFGIHACRPHETAAVAAHRGDVALDNASCFGNRRAAPPAAADKAAWCVAYPRYKGFVVPKSNTTDSGKRDCRASH
jgi:hypothetical protein